MLYQFNRRVSFVNAYPQSCVSRFAARMIEVGDVFEERPAFGVGVKLPAASCGASGYLSQSSSCISRGSLWKPPALPEVTHSPGANCGNAEEPVKMLLIALGRPSRVGELLRLARSPGETV